MICILLRGENRLLITVISILALLKNEIGYTLAIGGESWGDGIELICLGGELCGWGNGGLWCGGGSV